MDILDELFQLESDFFEMEDHWYPKITYTPYRGPPRPQQSPSATNVRITKQVLESILHNPTYFTQINYDKPPEHCQYLKISEPTDLTLFPGGKNYQTKISNELKQIYSYTPGSYEKYQDMIKAKKVLKMAPPPPQNNQPSPKPRTPPPPPNQSVPAPQQINGQLHQVFHLYDKNTGRTIQAIKGANGSFTAIGQSSGQIFHVANGQSSGSTIMAGNAGQQQQQQGGQPKPQQVFQPQQQNSNNQQFQKNSMNPPMSQPIMIQQPQAQQIHIQQPHQQVQLQQGPPQQAGSTMVINTSSSNGGSSDNGNNAYITSEVNLGNEARNSLEMQKNVIKTQIHQTRRQMVQSFMPRPAYQSQPIAANSPQPVQAE
ncbi:Oidioi.mRNA.OKI2018_I69.chr2.g8245.t3.cds [Oikopleura dioica]|uniref:Oidioi.mRNA.OKI2018_I69.chr2.g8245.t3.cds n=1 Tax=Oikopleura dioica TaxID=34765 RepID=A0ABN7TC02_OIKDI|nr:Oidioi.mRNA.OKI2018_I69.chr2.g8245.t3.cds [Oikopleura dioica]